MLPVGSLKLHEPLGCCLGQKLVFGSWQKEKNQKKKGRNPLRGLLPETTLLLRNKVVSLKESIRVMVGWSCVLITLRDIPRFPHRLAYRLSSS